MSTNIATIDTGRALAHPAAANMPAGAHQRGITPEAWHVMSTVLFKGASPEMICTLVDYCKARKLDPLKRPFHIVQVWDNEARRMAESIWPGIGELRTTAMRTGNYAGKSEIEFGPDQKKTWEGLTVEFPEWAQCRVYRIVGGQRVEFAGSKVYWLETYASKKGGAPNAMWAKRPRGQLAKCAEAEALRSAFPEEIGHQLTAEEMEGQSIGPDHARDVTPARSEALVEVIDAYGEAQTMTHAEAVETLRDAIKAATGEELDAIYEANADLIDGEARLALAMSDARHYIHDPETGELDASNAPFDWSAWTKEIAGKIDACETVEELTILQADNAGKLADLGNIKKKWADALNLKVGDRMRAIGGEDE